MIPHQYLLFLIVLVNLAACSSNDDIDDFDYKQSDCLVLIPDIQNYTDKEDWFKYPEMIADFCVNSKDLNIVGCFQTGDLTNNNLSSQYDNAWNHFFSLFSKEKYPIFCLGNHDYGNDGSSDTRVSNVPSYFYQDVLFRMEDSSYDNYLRYVVFNSTRYAVMVLEFAPRNEVLVWANNFIKEHANTPFIILTHGFLNNNGQMFDSTNPSCNNLLSQKSFSMGGVYLNDSKEIFQKLVYNNTNIQFIICGHCLSPRFIEYLPINNCLGKTVHCIMVNFQHYSEGGEGYVGCLFGRGDRFILRTYSTLKKEFGSNRISFNF